MPTTYNYCPRCGKPVESAAHSYCPSCGQPLNPGTYSPWYPRPYWWPYVTNTTETWEDS